MKIRIPIVIISLILTALLAGAVGFSVANRVKVSQQQNTVASPYISIDTAKETAIENANLSKDDVKILSCKLDNDNGRAVYDVEFYCGNTEYDCDIDAITGEIIDWEADNIDFD